MKNLSSHDIVMMFASLGLLLASARALGELCKHFRQPVVLGELIAGILLGPSCFGAIAPAMANQLFPATGPGAIVLQGFSNIAVALFLLVAGMEVDLGTVWRQGRIAIVVSLSGIIFPFGVGFTTAWYAGDALARLPDGDPFVFALFFATCLSISALSVIAKTLIDLNLFRTDLGMTIIAAAIFEDFAGWIIFAIILGLMGGSSHGLPISVTIGLTLFFALAMLTGGRLLINRVLPVIQAHTSWPGGVLGFTLAVAFFCAALTEWFGVHAVFGAFIAGVTIGDSDHLRERTRTTIDQFVSFIFAPIFFASIGLKVNFLTSFNLSVVLVVLVVACIGKIIGCTIGARIGGMNPNESWALGFGMNARGAMEIVLGLLGLQNGLIGDQLFVALVMMTIFTATISGPMMQRFLRRKTSRQIVDIISDKGFIPQLAATTAHDAIIQMASCAAPLTPLSAGAIAAAVFRRERMMPTGIGFGVAAPHARMRELKSPLVIVAVAPHGINFGGPDGQSARLIFMLLTPHADDSCQLELISDVARTFQNPALVQAALQVASFTELMALLRTREGKAQRSIAPAEAS